MSHYQPHILYIDNHLLAVCKPARMLIQRDRTGDESLLDLCRAYLKKRFNKPGNVYLGLVHRLDRPVSGVVVFARTSRAAGRLSEQFRSNRARKIYRALVEGKVPDNGIWTDRLVRLGSSSKLGEGDESKEAELSFRRISYHDNISLVEIEPKTGRHHQIRIQFAGRGHPVIGDFRYGSKIKFGKKALALHARSLTVTHPTKKEEMTFVAEVENSWREFFNN